jgi:hypothetical protein
MAQTLFGSNATPSLPLLDQNFTQLYEMRELISTPGYTAAAPKMSFGTTALTWGPASTASQQFSIMCKGGASSISLTATGATFAAPYGVFVAGTVGVYSAQPQAYLADGTYFVWGTPNEVMRLSAAGVLLLGRTAQSSGGKLEVAGNVVLQPSAGAPTLGVNGDMSFQLVSNTSLKMLVRGSDGVTRSTTLTLA